MSHTLEQLVEAAGRDDRRAFSELVRRFEGMAIGSAYARLRDRGLAHDVAQEAFTDAYLHLDQLRDARAFPGWLVRIVYKHCDRIWRRRSHAAVPLDGVREPAGEADAPDRTLDRARESARLWEAVEALPEAQRLVVALHYLGGEKVDDIAALLSLPAGTVKKRLFTARRRLEEALCAMLNEQRDRLLRPAGTSLAPRVEIFLAVRAGDLKAVTELLDDRPDLVTATEDWDVRELGVRDLPPPNRATALIRAVERGHREIAELLLDRGADVDGHCECAAGESPLWAAVVNGRHEIARLLLERGAKPDLGVPSGATPLHAAAIGGDLRAVDLLLAAGADRAARAAGGDTPYEWARAKGHGDVVSRLEPETQRAAPPDRAPEPVEPPHLTTGIASLDLFAPITPRSLVHVPGAVGLGRNVLLAELAHNWGARGGVSVWALWPRHPWEVAEVDHLVAETHVGDVVEIVRCAPDDDPARRSALAAEALARAVALADQGFDPVALVLFVAEGNRRDVEALYPKLVGLEHPVATWVVDPLDLDAGERRMPLARPFDAVVSFDPAMLAAGHLPAIDPVATVSEHLRSEAVGTAHVATAGRARELLARLRELDPALDVVALDGLDPADRRDVRCARELTRLLDQPFHVAEAFLGRPGEARTPAETIAGVEAILGR